MIISGINFLSFYQVAGKRILLTGDSHTLKDWCEPMKVAVNIVDFINDLISETPKDTCLDIFLEGSVKVGGRPMRKNAITEIYEELEPGDHILRLLQLSDLNKQKNLRVHYTDPRSIPGDSTGLKWNYFYLPWNYLSGNDEKLREYVSISDLYKALDYLLTINRNGNRKYFLKIFEKESEKKISDLEKWEKSYFQIVEKQLRKLDKTIMSRKTFLSNLRTCYHEKISWKHFYDSFSTVLTTILAAPMDIYTLSRLFTKFDDKPNRYCNKPTIENVIIHAGSGHSRFYSYFLTSSFGTEPIVMDYTDDPNNSCLSVTDFTFWE